MPPHSSYAPAILSTCEEDREEPSRIRRIARGPRAAGDAATPEGEPLTEDELLAIWAAHLV